MLRRRKRLRIVNRKNLFPFILLNLLVILVFSLMIMFYFLFLAPVKIKVLSSSVVNEQTISPLQESIAFKFNSFVDKDLVEKSFAISPSVLGEITWKNGKTLVFQLDEHLQENAKYEIQFELKGSPLPFFPTTTPELFNLQFKTGNAPKIVFTSPRDHEKQVALNKYIIFEFNQKITTDNFKNYFFVKPSVSGKLKAENNQIIFIPDNSYIKNTRYMAGVLKGLPGIDQQQLTQDYFINFQTVGDDETGEFQNVAAARVPILMYHNIGYWVPYESALSRRFKIEPQNLDGQLQYISENYNVVTLNDIYDYLTNGIELPENPLVLTFDDGWRGVYTYAFPLLKKYNLHFTIFLITSHYESKPGYLTKEEIKEMRDSGLVDLGNHTVDHPMLGFLSKTAIEREIKDANTSLKHDFGVDVKTFAYPGGSYNKIVLEVLERLGFRTAVTVNAGQEQKENELLLLKRIGVDGGDTVETLMGKLENK